MEKRALLMHNKDNVATLIDEASPQNKIDIYFAGEIVASLTSCSEIEHYHKVALVKVSKGDLVYKYGEVIGVATKDIDMGEHVHVNNIESVMTI